MPTLGERIKERRLELGLTVRGFAASVGVQPPFVTDIEANRRRPSPLLLIKIASTLRMPLAELESLDPRITPAVKEWMDEEPRVSTLLRRIRSAPSPDDLLNQIEKVVDDQEREGGADRP